MASHYPPRVFSSWFGFSEHCLRRLRSSSCGWRSRVLPLALLLVFCFTNSAAAQFEFTNFSGFDTVTPRSLAHGDLNNDGNPDLVVGGTGINVFSGDGQGGFTPISPQPTTSNVVLSVAVGDLDQDGSTDIVASSTTTLTVVLNSPAGGFAPPVDLPIPALGRDIALADYNSDGALDVLLLLPSEGIYAYAGNGTGTLAAPVITSLPEAFFTLATGDFDEDGNPDLALGGGTLGLSWVTGDGTGNFSALQNLPVPAGQGFCVAVDLNGDQHLDIVTSGASSEGATLLGDGTGSFAMDPFPAQPSGLPLARDFNGDGVVDLILTSSLIASFPHEILVYIGDGSGVFAQPVARYTSVRPFFRSAAADFDLDGVLDLAVCDTNEQRVTIARGLGNAVFAAPELLLPGSTIGAAAAIDFDMDGQQDLLVSSGLLGGQGSAAVSVLTGLGGGAYQLTNTFDAGLWLAEDIAVTDLNNDGLMDIVLGRTGPNVSILTQGPAGDFTATFLPAVADDPTHITVADLNEDGFPDIAAMSRTSQTISLWLSNGGGPFTGPLPLSTASIAFGITHLDANEDGHIDLAVGRVFEVSVFLGDGQGNFMEQTHNSGVTALDIEALDLNGDGHDDLVVSGRLGFTAQAMLGTLLGDGQGNFPTTFTESASGTAQFLATGDFDSDGVVDFITTTDDAALSLFMGSVPGQALPPVDLPLLGSARRPLVVDLDGDSDVDLAIPTDGGLILIDNRGVNSGDFLRGDCDDSGSANLADVVRTLNVAFSANPPTCADACDSNDDGSINIVDAVYLANYLFAQGQLVPAPFNFCGPDPTSDTLRCASFAACP